MDAEGLRLEAYRCPRGIWTIGYGHTGDVAAGQKITQHQAEAILELDLERFEKAVSQLAPTANANQFSAMVSFAFNVGVEALKKSALLKYFNSGRTVNAAAEFGKWIYAGTEPLSGLVTRRAAERALFLIPEVRA